MYSTYINKMSKYKKISKLYKKYIQNNKYVYNKEAWHIIIYEIKGEIRGLEEDIWLSLKIYKCNLLKLIQIINTDNIYETTVEINKYKVMQKYRSKCFLKVEDVGRKIQTYDNNKKIKYKYYVLNNKRWGKDKRYYKSGQIAFIHLFKHGVLHGIYREWYKSGQIWTELYFINGVIHGIYKAWYESGQIMIEQNYINGNLHGIRREWNKSGQIVAEYYYVNGTLI